MYRVFKKILGFLGPPTLLNQPQDLRVFPGQTAHFSCMMNGPLKYSVTWLKDERPLIINEAKMVLMPSGKHFDLVLLTINERPGLKGFVLQDPWKSTTSIRQIKAATDVMQLVRAYIN